MVDNSWVKEGAKVAILGSFGWHGHRLAGTSTIAKVGKRDIVLANGRKFRLADLSEQGRDRIYGDSLVAHNDPKIAEIKAQQEYRRIESAARETVGKWVNSRSDRDLMQGVVTTMQALLDAVDPDED